MLARSDRFMPTPIVGDTGHHACPAALLPSQPVSRILPAPMSAVLTDSTPVSADDRIVSQFCGGVSQNG